MTAEAPTTAHGFIEALHHLRVWQQGGKRAPHKPLLLLTVLGRLLEGRSGLFSFEELEERVAPVLASYAPARTKPEVTHPFWYLRSDGLWEIPDVEGMERQASGFPRKSAFNAVSGRLPVQVEDLLRRNPSLIHQAIQLLLDEHFTPSLEDDIRGRLGLFRTAQPADEELVAAEPIASYRAPRRDPEFRRSLLTAYQHRCAVSGFRAALDGHFFGVQAAHVMWHSQGGPDRVNNGLVLNPMLHFLLDAGAWTLSDERRVMVSARYAGDSDGEALLLQYHGQAVADPSHGFEPVASEYIHWHRDSEAAVFRGPALPLP